MKCYTWEFGRVSPGIRVTEDKSLGNIVSLGEKGRGGGRYHEKVEFLSKKPPEIKIGHVYDAHPVKITTNLEENEHYYVLAKPPDSEIIYQRILIRIRTRWVAAYGTHGIWKSIAGAPVDLMVGYGAHGIAVQRVSTWYDGLVLLTSGDAVCITPEGGYKVERYVVYCDESGALQDVLFSEYRSKIASVTEEVFI